MKGDKKVIDALNEVLTAELTAINIYYLHYKMQEDWGYEKLAAHAKEESMGEMKHANKIIERILFLDGAPNMARYDEILVGSNVEQQLKNQLKIEMAHVERLRKHIKLCIEKNDYATKEMLDEILVEGINTNIDLHKDVIMRDSGFNKGGVDIHYLEKILGLH